MVAPTMMFFDNDRPYRVITFWVASTVLASSMIAANFLGPSFQQLMWITGSAGIVGLSLGLIVAWLGQTMQCLQPMLEKVLLILVATSIGSVIGMLTGPICLTSVYVRYPGRDVAERLTLSTCSVGGAVGLLLCLFKISRIRQGEQ
jgi:hypothetical protein